MKNLIIFSPQSIEFEVLRELVKEKKIFITSIFFWEDDNKKKLELYFPSIKKINCNQIIDNGLAGKFDDIDQTYFTHDTKLKFLYEENIFINMIDRYDTSNNIKYSERYNLYKYLICNFYKVFEEEKPDYFYCRNTPHEIVDYAAYIVFKSKKVKPISFQRSIVTGYYFLKTQWDSYNINSRKNYKSFSSKILKKNILIKKYINSLNQNSISALPKYMLLSRSKPFFLEILKIYLKSAIRKLSNISFFDLENKNYYYKLMSDFCSNRHRKKNFKKSYYDYLNLCQDELKFKNYIYFPLHYQPEATTCPEGGFYNDQFLAISILSKSIPKDWHIYIKEHDAQHNYISGYLGRDLNYYKRLSKFKNISFIHPNYQKHLTIIKNSKLVATINGTVGVEAFILKKPVIAFGDFFMSSAPNIFKIVKDHDCKTIIDLVKSDKLIFNEKKIYQFINFLIYNSIKIDFGNTDGLWNKKYNKNKNKKILKNVLLNIL